VKLERKVEIHTTNIGCFVNLWKERGNKQHYVHCTAKASIEHHGIEKETAPAAKAQKGQASSVVV